MFCIFNKHPPLFLKNIDAKCGLWSGFWAPSFFLNTHHIHPSKKYCKCGVWREKKIEIIEDVHIKHNPKQKEKQINKKSKKHKKKHWSKENS